MANQKATVFKNAPLRLYSRVGETQDEFIARTGEAAEGAGDEAMAKLKDTYAAKIDRVRDSISKAENRVADLQAEASSRQSDELLSGAGDLLGAFLGRAQTVQPPRSGGPPSRRLRESADAGRKRKRSPGR